MAKPPKRKFYVVWRGRRPGVYDTWDEAAAEVHGYAGARHASFPSRDLAEAAFRSGPAPRVAQGAATAGRAGFTGARPELDPRAVAVDAACSGVPGPLEYRGVIAATGEELFRKGPFEDGTNNIGEFLAIVHALALLEKQQASPDVPIYSDSVTAISWVRARRCRTRQERTGRNDALFELIARAEKWLSEHGAPYPILKWETSEWGEIPADYGRK